MFFHLKSELSIKSGWNWVNEVKDGSNLAEKGENVAIDEKEWYENYKKDLIIIPLSFWLSLFIFSLLWIVSIQSYQINVTPYWKIDISTLFTIFSISLIYLGWNIKTLYDYENSNRKTLVLDWKVYFYFLSSIIIFILLEYLIVVSPFYFENFKDLIFLVCYFIIIVLGFLLSLKISARFFDTKKYKADWLEKYWKNTKNKAS